ncbi:MAG TPA: 2-oxoacid:acceptor oxidoreductase family protein [Terriglobales bacterium]|nr:2-oxoacid:acceptor oxidoreductase family protein [Terriglobales bacterium]
MTRWDIVFAGVGGQGLLSCGNLLGEAATVHCGLNAAMVASYGVETRGTFTKADLIISEEEIDFPEVEHPRLVLCLHPVAYERYVSSVGEDVTLIYDSSLVTPGPSRAAQFGYPISETAEKAGSLTSANILAIGILIGKFGLLPESAVEAVIAGSRPKAAARNLALFRQGVEMAK